MAEYISRTELVKNLDRFAPEHFTDLIRSLILKQPTADVREVKHGHWIWLEGNFYECSECPNKTEVDEAMNEPLYIYCPFCGAKMDGRRDE